MGGALGHPHPLERRQGFLLVGDRMVVLREHHVLDSAEMLHQMELLEDQPDLLPAHVGQLRLPHLVEPFALK
ncbi:hypothetical protein SDC9_142207 [bioreactor metagenome]|uniref:Uncharacterized protein n=1 Tax=bioreactor metagenome TaxID=1076179 RepID=A0A645E0F8_9ZZZZ